jgi:hypothetical protein
MAISVVGSFSASHPASATTAHTMTITNAGDLVVIFLAVANGTGIVPTALTGNNGVGALSSTASVYDAGTGAAARLFYGPCPNSGSTTFTPSYSATPPSDCQYDAREFTAGFGTATVWTLDTSNTQVNATTPVFPSLTAAGTGELYVGGMAVQAQGLAGTTSGFTYDVDTAYTDILAYNPNASGTLTPNAGQSGGTRGITAAALITASTSYASPYRSSYSSYF